MAHIIGTVSLNKNVYSLRDIAQYEHISDEKIECLMSDTLKMAVRSSELKTAAGIQAFFNEIGVYDSMINRFIYHTKLKPLRMLSGFRRKNATKETKKCITLCSAFLRKYTTSGTRNRFRTEKIFSPK